MAISVDNKYMLAASAPLLQQEQLCQFLQQMDQQEIQALDEDAEGQKRELADLAQQYSWTSIALKGVVTGGKMVVFMGLGQGFATMVLTNSPIRTDSSPGAVLNSMRFGLALGAGIGVCGGIMNECEQYYTKKRAIEVKPKDAHILRLRDKIRTIKTRLDQTDAQDEQKQLPQANDWFALQLQHLQLSRTNTIQVVHRV